MENVLVLSEKDNIGNAIEDIAENQKVIFTINNEIQELIAKEKIPFGFKIALKDISKNKAILKYGEIIGQASKDIISGQLVHVHNMEGRRGRGDLLK